MVVVVVVVVVLFSVLMVWFLSIPGRGAVFFPGSGLPGALSA